VLARIEEFHRIHGPLWEPAPLLAQLVAQGQSLSGYVVPTDPT
jgi:3-hydroxyacyl-CoA dehydrogenase